MSFSLVFQKWRKVDVSLGPITAICSFSQIFSSYLIDFAAHFISSRQLASDLYPLIYRTPRSDSDLQCEQVYKTSSLIASPLRWCSPNDYCYRGEILLSPNGRYLAEIIDHSGEESFSLYITDLEMPSPPFASTLVDHRPAGVYFSLSWMLYKDECFILYTTIDESNRPYRVYSHRYPHFISPFTDVLGSVLLFRRTSYYSKN